MNGPGLPCSPFAAQDRSYGYRISIGLRGTCRDGFDRHEKSVMFIRKILIQCYARKNLALDTALWT